jgi:hypothetical protein
MNILHILGFAQVIWIVYEPRNLMDVNDINSSKSQGIPSKWLSIVEVLLVKFRNILKIHLQNVVVLFMHPSAYIESSVVVYDQNSSSDMYTFQVDFQFQTHVHPLITLSIGGNVYEIFSLFFLNVQ